MSAPVPGRMHLILGPVGAGKSTYAARLAAEQRAVRFTLDEWMAALFWPDRPSSGVMEWYVERTERCVDLIWTQAVRTVVTGTDVVLEIGLIRRAERERLYERVDVGGHQLHLHLLDAPREVRWARVERRNQERGATFSMEVPPAIFAYASDLWEPVDDDECSGRPVQRTVAEW